MPSSNSLTTGITVNSVNLANTEIINGSIVAVFPPGSPYSALFDKPGVQTTSQLSRGYLPGSAINAMNGQLSHVCDFKFIFGVNFDLGGFVLPDAALMQAISNAKLAAAAKLAQLTQAAMKELRAVINTIITALSFDPSGQFSLNITIAKKYLREINYWIKWAAQQVEDVLTWVFLAQQIIQLINWIKSLPDKIKQLLQNCLANFQNSFKSIATSLQTLPANLQNQTVGQAQILAQQFSTSVTQNISQLQSSISSVNNSLPGSVINVIGSPNSTSANSISDVISSWSSNNNSYIANAGQPAPMP